MGYTLYDRLKMMICKVFNHFPRGEWEYEGTHAHCACCRKIITKYGKRWK